MASQCPPRRYAPAETQCRVLAAALKLFSAKGILQTKTAEIARDAGVSEGSIFYHFGSKQNLFVQAGQAHARSMIEEAQGDRSLQELDLGVSVVRCIDYCLEHRTRANAALVGNGVTYDEYSNLFFDAAREILVEWIATLIGFSRATTCNVQYAASFSFAVVSAAIEMAGVAVNDRARDEIVAEAVRYLRAGLGVDAGTSQPT